MHPVRIHHVEDPQRRFGDEAAFECAVGLGRVQPYREENIDLVDVAFERSVAAGVIIYVISRAQTFPAIEGNFRRFAAGFTPRRLQILGLDGSGLFLDSAIIPPRSGQQQLRQSIVSAADRRRSGDSWP